jgi:hypothetical protein
MVLLATLDPMLTALDSTDGMALLAAPDPTNPVPNMTALHPSQ